jgi:hypothetical protein
MSSLFFFVQVIQSLKHYKKKFFSSSLSLTGAFFYFTSLPLLVVSRFLLSSYFFISFFLKHCHDDSFSIALNGWKIK